MIRLYLYGNGCYTVIEAHLGSCRMEACDGKETEAFSFQRMTFKRKTLVLAGLLVLTVLVMTIFLLTEGEAPPPREPSLKVLSDKVDAQIKDVLYTETGDDDLKWEIRADNARYAKKENLAIFENVTVKLVMSEGRTFIMTGDRGELSTDKKDMRIAGHVKIVSDRGDIFLTDRLKYINAERRITTDAPVRLNNNKMQVSGSGMSLSLTQREMNIPAGVKALVR